MLEVLSYGGGVQTAAMLALVDKGKLPKPDIIIHADTGSELPETEENVRVWAQEIADRHDIPFVIVTATINGVEDVKLHEYYESKSTLPMVQSRSCTDNFKIQPIRRYVKKYLGYDRAPRNKVIANMWLGITTDEARRMGESHVKYVQHWYPFIALNMSRKDCIKFLKDNGYPVPIKSGCFMCMYQSKRSWRRLANKHPELFRIAVDMEEKAMTRTPDPLSVGLSPKGKLTQFWNGTTLEEWIEIEEPEGCDSMEHGGCFL